VWLLVLDLSFLKLSNLSLDACEFNDPEALVLAKFVDLS